MENGSNSSFDIFIRLLKEQLKLPLPGKEAQYIMASAKHQADKRYLYDVDSAKKASVLILLYLKNHEVTTVLIKRTAYNGVHSSQISLPGGKFENTDETLFHTACREAYEEIGINIPRDNLIGKISDLYIPPSNFLVSPFVAFTNTPPLFRTDPKEVESILEIKLSVLINDSTISEKEVYTSGNISIMAPCYYINDSKIWGATAMIISELKTIINKIPEAVTILQS